MRKLSIYSASVAVALWTGGALAQGAYPSRGLVFICAFPAGSSSDAIVRFMADKIRPLAKQTILVENRMGASGAVATEYTLRAKPDGHTIFVHSPTAIAANDVLMKTPPANTKTALRVAATINRQAFILSVDAGKPYKTLSELTDAVRPKGTKASFATYATVATITGALYKKATGIEAVEVPYRVGAQTLNDMQSGALDFGIYDPLFALAQERAGRLRSLAIVSTERMETSPHVPTFTELGIPIVLAGWFAAVVPADTPEPAVRRINEWFSEVVRQEETKKFLNNVGSEPWIATPEQAQAAYLAAFESYAKAVREAGIQPK